MKEYTYRLLNIENISDINELFKAAFSLEPKDNFVMWKYFSNPVGNAILVGAFYGDKLVSSGAMIPEIMNIFKSEKVVYKCTDLMTHPEHQRKGLSKKINEILIEEIKKMDTPFVYTLCSNISTKSFLRNNWIFLERVTNFFKPYLILKINTILNKSNFENIRLYNFISSQLDTYKFKTNTFKISVKKTPDYLKWRTSNPNFIYKIICSYDINNQVNGYLIYSISINNLLNIIDIESSNNDKIVKNKLILYAEYLAVKEKHKGILVLAIKNSSFYDFVKSKNYLWNPFQKGPLKTILDFDTYIYDSSLTNINNLSIWNINGLSYDDI